MKMCKWCVAHEPDKKPLYKYPDPDVSDALAWLKIEKSDICIFCRNSLRIICERITQHFIRPFNVMEPISYKYIKYEEIPYDIKVIGWLSFLQDHLRDFTYGHYFKKRWDKEINPNRQCER